MGWRGWPVVQAELATLVPLHPPVGHDQAFLQRLEDDIVAQGLVNPLIVTLLAPTAVEAHRESREWLDPAPERWALAVIVGNQRWHVLTGLGITAVDVCIVPDINTGNRLARQMREGFNYLHEDPQ